MRILSVNAYSPYIHKNIQKGSVHAKLSQEEITLSEPAFKGSGLGHAARLGTFAAIGFGLGGPLGAMAGSGIAIVANFIKDIKDGPDDDYDDDSGYTDRDYGPYN